MQSAIRARRIVALLLALLAAASMWFYVRRIDVIHQRKQAEQFGIPRGNLSDLYPRWLGARELLLRGRNPYSPEITSEIQRGFYGRELDPSRPNDPKDPEAFAYPAYVAFVLAPTVRMEFAAVRLLALWLFTGATILSVWFWQDIVGSDVSLIGFLTLTLLVIGCYPFVEGIALQQLSLLVAALLASSFFLRRRGCLFVSGVLLAIATIKPQLALLPALLMVIWVFGNWSERQRWLFGFVSTSLLLGGGAEYLLPGWMVRFYDATREYTEYIKDAAFLDLLLTPRWGGAGRAIIGLIVLWVCWQVRRFAPDNVASMRALSLTLAGAILLAPNRGTYNQVLLLPGLLLILCHRNSQLHAGMVFRQLRNITWLLLIWPWLACGFLIAARLFQADGLVQLLWQLPLYTTLSLPVVLFILLLAVPSDPMIPLRTSPAAEKLA